MAKSDQKPIDLRFIIERPVVGQFYSLQAKDGSPLDPKSSRSGKTLAFQCQVRVGPGPTFFGDQVRREGQVRRFVYVRIGDLAGDPSSPWSRRMKIDIHDIPQDMVDLAVSTGRAIEHLIDGTGKDGTPACGTVKPMSRRLAED